MSPDSVPPRLPKASYVGAEFFRKEPGLPRPAENLCHAEVPVGDGRQVGS
jgi:hypothetical protein